MLKLLRRGPRALTLAAAVLLVGSSLVQESAVGSTGRRSRKLASLEQGLALLPGRNHSFAEKPGDALNLVFVGAEADLLRALGAAGWTRVPGTLPDSFLQGLVELGGGRAPAAFPPISPYRLYGRVQDLSFAIPTDFPHARHHFRLWRSPFEDEKGRPIWWGSGDYDVSIRWSDLSHRTDPDMDAERDYIAGTLVGKAALRWVPLSQIPTSGANDRGYAFRNDGRALIAEF